MHKCASIFFRYLASFVPLWKIKVRTWKYLKRMDLITLIVANLSRFTSESDKCCRSLSHESFFFFDWPSTSIEWKSKALYKGIMVSVPNTQIIWTSPIPKIEPPLPNNVSSSKDYTSNCIRKNVFHCQCRVTCWKHQFDHINPSMKCDFN